MRKALWFFAFVLVTSFLGGCASQKVRIESDEELQVTLIPWGTKATETKSIGKTPLDTTVDAINDGILRFNAKGRLPQYWVLACNPSRERLEARVVLDDAQSVCQKMGVGGGGADSAARDNRLQRIIFRAYRSLLNKEAKVAADLADQATQLNPDLAMPYVIKGMALIQLDQKDAAAVAFRKAKNLDPGDGEIDKLLKLGR